MRKLTLKQMYGYLFSGCIDFKKANVKGEFDVDRNNRSCNKYAVKNTVKCWKAQYGKA